VDAHADACAINTTVRSFESTSMPFNTHACAPEIAQEAIKVLRASV